MVFEMSMSFCLTNQMFDRFFNSISAFSKKKYNSLTIRQQAQVASAAVEALFKQRINPAVRWQPPRPRRPASIDAKKFTVLDPFEFQTKIWTSLPTTFKFPFPNTRLFQFLISNHNWQMTTLIEAWDGYRTWRRRLEILSMGHRPQNWS